MSNQKDQMKWVLFWVFLILFVMMVLGTLAMVFLGFGSPTESERGLMVKGLIGEVAACIIALFYSIFGLRGETRDTARINDLEEKINQTVSAVELLKANKNSAIMDTGYSVKESASDKDNIKNYEYISSFEKIISNFKMEPPFSLEEYELTPLAIDIKNDIRDAKPFDKNHREQSYIGLKVQWKATFSGINEENDGIYRITADVTDKTVLILSFCINKSLSNKFKYLDKDTPFWVSGEISKVDSLEIQLDNAQVKFEE